MMRNMMMIIANVMNEWEIDSTNIPVWEYNQTAASRPPQKLLAVAVKRSTQVKRLASPTKQHQGLVKFQVLTYSDNRFKILKIIEIFVRETMIEKRSNTIS